MSRTPYTPIAEGSQATPGLWNAIFSALSTDLDVVLSTTTSTFSSSVTVTGGVTLVGPLSVQSGVVRVTANSNSTDYLFLTDSSNQRSSYILGSKAGGTADGLNLWDDSGATMIVNFSKQSIRFFQPVVGPIFDQGGQVFAVKNYGALGNGVADDSAAIETATIAANGGTVFFSAGTYLVTRQLNLGTTWYKWLGIRNERAVGGDPPGQPRVSIQFRPSVTTTMVRVVSTNSALPIGPFEHENILFDANDATTNPPLFQFGDEALSLDTGQPFLFGVRFDKCKFLGPYAATSSSSTGVVARSGQTLLNITKAFETIITECRFQGGDTQVRLFGNEKPLIDRTWMLYANVAVDLQGGGNPVTFYVQNQFSNVQFNGWILAAIRTNNSEIACSNFRMERGSLGTGSDWYQLVNADGSASTVSCSANTSTLAFGRDMTNVLFPNLSVILLRSGISEFPAMVKTVSGTTVTFYDTNNLLTWTASAATVLRLHSYGAVVNSGFDAAFVNGSIQGGTKSPPFVYNVNSGLLFVTNVSQPYGSGTSNSASLVIGNKLPGQSQLDSQACFQGCSPYIVPDPSNPFVQISNIRPDQGQRRHPVFGSTAFSTEKRARLGNLDSDAFYGRRKWAWTPKSYSENSASAPYAIPLLQVPGEVGTLEKPWVWDFRSDLIVSNLQLTDESLSTTAPIRLAFRARAANANATLRWRTRSGANIDSLQTVTLTSTWTTVESYMTTPPAWQGSNRSTVNTGIEVVQSPDNEFWLAAVTAEELPNTSILGVGGTAIAPMLAPISEQSLGLYRSIASTLALSYGTLLLQDGAGPPHLSLIRGNNETGLATGPEILLTGPAPGSVLGANLQIGFRSYGGANIQTVIASQTTDTAGFEGAELVFGTGAGQSTATEKMRLTRQGQLLVVGGAATLPANSFLSETSLGFYRSAASTQALSYGTMDFTAAVLSVGSLKIKAGANQSCGTAVLGSNGSVNVANTYVKTGDLVFLTDQTPGGTLGDLELTGIRNSSGFTIASTSVTDTSTVAWLIVRPG